jgi:dienelactone hydrolase
MIKTYVFTVNFQMITDRVYLVDGARATKLQAAATKSPVYFYLFGYRGKHSFTEVNSGTTNNYGKIVVTTVLTKCS